MRTEEDIRIGRNRPAEDLERPVRDRGPAISRVQTADGHEPSATEYFTSMGDCPTGRP
ncbi:hypothetical protein QC334_04405 [Streptomyces sp. DH18]|uniref:hypothetical protein n=1 Tax=Streptomyces sp. DH18 TaxID=3040126 RepID=UPI0024428553|nr:hypothetical protein [Streptomyces sp. DH18]MDG9681990.1 hypothetical protein [Streptomyces sp. DH18]